MKVLLINGSRREKGCTYTALREVAGALEKNGIETVMMHIGKRALNGEIDMLVHEAAEVMKDCDGLVVGSPVYYASPSGEVLAFLDRLFWSHKKILEFKPGAAIVSARRAGTSASLDVLNKYFTIVQMPLVSSRYWNMVHGNTPDEVVQDEEGMLVMRALGNNMAWLLKSIEAGRSAGVSLPEQEPSRSTNFIRRNSVG